MNGAPDDVVIGLEVHIQLSNLKTKLFCSCSSNYRDAEPNTHVCPICLGLPGSLPVINKKSIEFATRLALALDCKINYEFWFFRKNYFYVDLPKGYQITQYNKAGGKAFADGGKVTIKINSTKKDILLNRIHLEEDPARLVHKGSIRASPYTLVDYNRSGITLIEIVTEPVLKSPSEAREFLNQLKLIVQYTGISDLSLEGTLRVDANISIKGHPRAEVKNISSYKEVESALMYEITRQKHEIKKGKEIMQETRHWDGRVTIPLRTKEFEKDYRYFPEQDLVPILIKKEFINEIKDNLPEMPYERALRLQKQYMLSEFDAENLILDKKIADFYENGVNKDPIFGPDEYKLYCNWLMNDIVGWLNENNKNITDTKLKPNHIIDLISNIKKGNITTKIAKTFIADMMHGNSISKMIKDEGKKRISEEIILEKYSREVIDENPSIIEDCRKNPKAIEALIGRVMGKTKGQADPKITRKIMIILLKDMKIID
ncbi:MAG: Asp-tRNA(Asn)/Glu-tRNA(Gln) amidotransferase subunit GatB [Candidatus Hodarchaeota archaeon]